MFPGLVGEVRGPVAGRGGTDGVPVRSTRGMAPVSGGGVSGKRAEAGGGGGISGSCRRSPAGRRFGKRDDAAEDVPREPVPSDACGRCDVPGVPEPGRVPETPGLGGASTGARLGGESVSSASVPSGRRGAPAAPGSCDARPGLAGPKKPCPGRRSGISDTSAAPRPDGVPGFPVSPDPSDCSRPLSAEGCSGGVEGRGGMEARRASVLMHPPFPRPRRPARRRIPSGSVPCLRARHSTG
ncbi:hypothetical protein QF035_008279 [Streptomyces umbrinus]|uniref:Uncharacterized protein n=1 Tax=Streptomyces umbrinus TaxID=67370 RepID=A0ABU0T550_9ACTN|nr:hypothetical protein [Streptomyces umbrinus]